MLAAGYGQAGFLNSRYKKNIPLHRGIRNLSTPRGRLGQILLLPVIASILLWAGSDFVGGYWYSVVELCLRKLDISAHVAMVPYEFERARIFLPHLQPTGLRSLHAQWQGILLLTIALLAMSFIRSDRFLPLKYYLRIIAFIQSTALLVLYFAPDRLPDNVAQHVENLMLFSLALMFIVPWVYGLTYNIFDMKLRYKIALTSIAVAYLALFTPFFLVLHLYLLVNVSILLMPVLYFLFGIMVPVMACIAFYGWAMSWR